VWPFLTICDRSDLLSPGVAVTVTIGNRLDRGGGCGL
jgi:hypothetical protein